jgi:hypothetical protein
MENFETINRFLEGSLNDEPEREFYTNLLSDDVLRAELRQILVFQRSMKYASSIGKVPLDTENELFAKVGFNKQNKGRAFRSQFISYSKNAGFVCIGAILTFFIMQLYGSTNSNKELYSNNNSRVNSVPFVSSRARLLDNNARLKEAVHKNVGFNNNNNIVNQDNSAQSKYSENSSEPKNINTIQIQRAINYSDIKNRKYSLSENMDFYSSNTQNNNILIESDDRNSTKFNIELSGVQPLYMEKTKINTNSVSPFFNTMCALSYSIYDDFKIGLNIRNESFYQHFNGKDKLTQYTEVDQQQRFTSVAAFGRKNIRISDRFNPILQFDIGFANNLNILRLGSGVEYKYSDNLSFILGVEFSGLFYKYYNNSFYSSKLGLNYGIIYNF